MKNFIFCVVLWLSLPAFAFNPDIDSQKCESHISHHERLNSIPPKLLKTISLVESGRWSEKQQKLVPWPWAVNNSGKSYYFNSKYEAVRFVESLISQGERNIDVGCMQINLKYHPNAFSSLHQAFEPNHNVAYAASFLKNNYQTYSNWPKAIAAYHSSNDIGRDYYRKIVKLWSEEKRKNYNDNYEKFSALNQKKPNFYHTRPVRNPKRLASDLKIY